jgi:hypothetical protein
MTWLENALGKSLTRILSLQSGNVSQEEKVYFSKTNITLQLPILTTRKLRFMGHKMDMSILGGN